MQKAVAKCNITQLMSKLIADEITNDIIEKTKKIHPLKQAYIYKVKVLKSPKLDCKDSLLIS